MMVVGALVVIGIPSVKPIPFNDLLFLFSYIAVFSLAANDLMKLHLMRWLGVTT